MKNKLCNYSLYTLLVGIFLPLAVSIAYIICLGNENGINSYHFAKETLKVAEAFCGCVIFSVVCAFLWDYLYKRYLA